MSRLEKLRARFLAMPPDFSWKELVTLLASCGYQLQPGKKTGGSRRKFTNADGVQISLHQPHPQPVLKRYQIKAVKQHLEQEGIL